MSNESQRHLLLRRMVKSHPVLRHAFFTLIKTREAHGLLRSWALEDFAVSEDFPASIRHLASRLPAGISGDSLEANLADEMGLEDEGSHCAQLRRLIQGMGISVDQHSRHVIAPETQSFISLQYEMADNSPLAGLSVFCYANEYLSLHEFRPIENAVRRTFPSADLSFFRSNLEMDYRHTADLERLVDTLYLHELEDPLPSIEGWVAAALWARSAIYDAVVRNASEAPIRAENH